MSQPLAPPYPPRDTLPSGGMPPPVPVSRPAPPAPARPIRRRGEVLWRLITVEAATIAVGLAALSGSLLTMITVGGVAVVVLALVFARHHGRWWTEDLAIRRRWRQRGATGSASITHVVQGYDDRGTVVGIGCDEGGWYAAAAIAPTHGVSGERAVDVPIERLAELLTDDAIPLTAVQVVTWVAPSPHYLLPPQTASVASYHQLAADLVELGPPPTEQRDWIAVRFRVTDAMIAAHTRGGGVEGVHRAVATAVARLGKALSVVGVSFEVLGPQQLAAAVRTCHGLPPRPPGQPDGEPEPTEQWSNRRVAGLDDIAFEVMSLPNVATPLSALLHTPAAQLVLSVELRRSAGDGPAAAREAVAGPQPADPANGSRLRAGTPPPSAQRPADPLVSVRAILRVTAGPDRIADVTRNLTDQANRIGVRLRRLDGWHGPAAYASSPTGGGPW